MEAKESFVQVLLSCIGSCSALARQREFNRHKLQRSPSKRHQFYDFEAYMTLNRNENDRKIKKELMRSIGSGCSGHFPPLIFTSLLQFLSKTMT